MAVSAAVKYASGLWAFLKLLFLDIPLSVAIPRVAVAAYPVVFGVTILFELIDEIFISY